MYKMKLTVALLLLAAVSQAAEERSSSRSSAPSRSKQKTLSNTDKRALVEGNAGVEKRTPAIGNALPSPTPGIEYADSKEPHTDKSPQQQIYATPVPQLAKISDVLTGQGPPYQAAIASHLFSPVSIYTPRLASPTYEISAPVPSQLAYSEKITYRPQTPEQFTPQVFKKPNFPRPTYPQQIQYQQLPQQQVLQYQPPQQVVQFQPQVPPQQILPQQYQQLPVYNPQPVQYQNPVQYTRQPIYIQQQLPAPAQPGIVYAQQEQISQKPIQRELKTAQPAQNNPTEKSEQNYSGANQGAVSYASFSVGPATTPQQKYQPEPQTEPQYRPQPQQSQAQPQPEIQYRPQPPQPQIQYQSQPQAQTEQYRPQPLQPQIQYQPQIQQYQTHTPQIQTQQQIQNQQYQIQRQPLPQFTPQYQNYQYQLQPQHQFQIQPQIIQKLEPSPVNSVTVPSKAVAVGSEKQISYYRPDPVVFQPQGFPQNLAFQNQFETQALPVPTFPPVQFFGKFAQSIFKNYQQ